jgi:hypothetical protein
MAAPDDAAKARRRWLTLGETIAVLALVISAASFWDAHQDRKIARATVEKPAAATPLVLKASPADDGDSLSIIAAGNDRVIQTQTIVFPASLGLDPVDTVGNARIEAGWFADALRQASPEPRKPGRMAIGIVTRYTDNGIERTDSALYDIGHGWRSRLLQSDMPRLEGITLVSRGGKDLAARVEARWRKANPPAVQTASPQ